MKRTKKRKKEWKNEANNMRQRDQLEPTNISKINFGWKSLDRTSGFRFHESYKY